MLTIGGFVGGLSLGPIVRRTLRSSIVQSVRVAIQQQRLAPGTRLSEAELAGKLGCVGYHLHPRLNLALGHKQC